VICGISMLQQTARVVRRARPPLGVLVWDDGDTTSLTIDLVVGRHPAPHDLVLSGRAEALVVNDGADRLSRAHLHVELRDWDVVATDLGSTNGTYHQAAATGSVSRLATGVGMRLADGDTLWLGARSFVFQSHHIG
jgi:pSer/pThr/pTyr-binding forkhead associated (FHA) protein